MARPTTRVLAVLELLQAHGRMSGPALAARVGVDVRTLRRHVAALEELGVPIVAERGRFGGYALVPGYKLPPLVFTNDEALALALGLLAARSLGLAEAAPATAGAQAKLERVLPTALRQRLRAVAETVALDLPEPGVAGDGAALSTLSAAAQARQRVRLGYRDAQGVLTERDVDPYGLAWRAGRWYAVGYCHLRGEVRSFRLDRVRRAAPLPASFGRPQDFDALAHLSHAVATLPRAHAIEVRLHADLATAREALFAAAGVLEPDGEGVRLHAQADDLDWFARELARLPFDFSVVSPVDLCGAVARQAERLRALAGPAGASLHADHT